MKLVDKILHEASLNEKTKEEIKQGHLKNTETGRTIKVSSALALPKENPAHQKAEQLLAQADTATAPVKKQPQTNPKAVADKPTAAEPKKNERSHKPQARSFGINKDAVNMISQKGIGKLSVYPQSFVKLSDIQFNPSLTKENMNKTWICKFPSLDKQGNTIIKTAYTTECLALNQKEKYKKISKIKSSDIETLEAKSGKLLASKHPEISDSACIIRIILKTGLRVGSKDADQTATGNLGVRTLKVENVTVKGDKVNFKFIGKSYQENVADLKDADVAQYISKAAAGKKPTDNLFGVKYSTVDKMMKKLNPKGISCKDLRTYKATEFAKKLLADKKLTGPPPPLPENPKEIKKVVKEKLLKTFEMVSKLLNNTPSMAKTSYVHPVVITDFLDSLDLKPENVGYAHPTIKAPMKKKKVKKESVGIDKETTEIDKVEDEFHFTSMDEMFAKYGAEEDLTEAVGINADEIGEEEDIEEYLLPRWFYDPNFDLVKKNEAK